MQTNAVSTRQTSGSSFRWARGSMHLVHVDDGCALVVVRGRLRLNAAPGGLAERAWTVAIDVVEGQAYDCGRGGWFRVYAASECEGMVLQTSKPDAAASLFEGIIRHWRAAFGRAALS